MELTVDDAQRQFRVRRATMADAARLSAVGAALFTQTFASQNTAENMQSYLERAFDEDVQRRDLADASNLIWIAEGEDATPIGYAHLKLGSSPPTTDVARAAELARIYADRRWHGQGVGAELLATCLDAARAWGASVIWLGVWRENPRGIAFYQKHGFHIVGEQTFRLGSDLQHDWVMLRDLDQ